LSCGGGEILCERQDGVACITLNRPAALNALTLEMIRELHALLRDVAADAALAGVLLRGSGDRSFCAGGDIRALYDSARSGGRLHEEFFVEEYRLDHYLHVYPKPVIAAIDGITMGGGMGLAQGASLRIVGERTRIAMPEVGIGLFPDVGGSYFLSRLRGELGAYLALTGTQIRAADALYAGLADVYLAPAAAAQLVPAVAGLVWNGGGGGNRGRGGRGADIEAAVRALASDPPPSDPTPQAPPLATLQPAIDEHFGKASIGAILDSLNGESRPAFAVWALETLRLVRRRSPTMLAVALDQLRRGRNLSLEDCFRMEAGMTRACFAQGDFLEGVRALLIDKDNAPRWRPDRIEDVTQDSVAAFFRDPWANGTHPLADLQPRR
jgi:enoyl-CoA hydratase/carnithine racemase